MPELEPYRRVLVVANPIAGRGRGERAARELREALAAEGRSVEVRLTCAAGDARRWALEAADADAADLLVSIGGDGTLREVLDGLAAADRSDLPVAMLPMGTANVLAVDFDLPVHVPGLLELVRGGEPRWLDLAAVGPPGEPGATSFLAVGVGLDGEVVARLDAAREGAITKLSYLPHVARAVAAYRPAELRVTLDGEELPGTYGQVIASNMIHYGGLMRLDPTTRADDGVWEVYLWRRARRRDLAGSFLRSLVGSLPGGACERRRGRELVVSSDAPVPYHVDGDPGGRTPLALTVTGRRQAVLAPPRRP